MKKFKVWIVSKLVSWFADEGYTVMKIDDAVELDADLLGVREHMYDISDDLRSEMSEMDFRLQEFEDMLGDFTGLESALGDERLTDDSYFLEVK